MSSVTLQSLMQRYARLSSSGWNARLPVPARIVIDKGGIVRTAEADPDYTTRPEVEDTLAVLRGIG
jgi:peroxiredoxin